MIHYVLQDDTGAFHIVDDVEMDNLPSVQFQADGNMSYAICQSWIANQQDDES